jgi:hypothetical protein
MCTGFVFLLLMPYITTQFVSGLDFTDTGEIGNTIGGTTAPVIGTVSALLIYLSFRAQINANRIIQQQIDDQKTEGEAKKNFEFQMELYKHLREHLVAFAYEEEKLRGSEALTTFLSNLGKQYIIYKTFNGTKHTIIQTKILIDYFNQIIDRINPEKSDRNSKFIYALTKTLFFHHIWSLSASDIEKVIKKGTPENPGDITIYAMFIDLEKIHRKVERLKKVWSD